MSARLGERRGEGVGRPGARPSAPVRDRSAPAGDLAPLDASDGPALPPEGPSADTNRPAPARGDYIRMRPPMCGGWAVSGPVEALGVNQAREARCKCDS